MVTPSSPEPSSEMVGVVDETFLEEGQQCASEKNWITLGNLLVLIRLLDTGLGEGDLSGMLINVLEDGNTSGARAEECQDQLGQLRAREHSPVDGMFSLPGTAAASRREVTSDLGSTRKEWGCNSQRRRKGQNAATVCADIVLVSSELSTFGCDALEILLSRSVCVADLKKETLFTNGLTMELLDDLFADLTALETAIAVSRVYWKGCGGSHRAKPTPRLLFWLSRRIRLELTV